MVNPNWERWIQASVRKHFKDKLTIDLPAFVLLTEGQEVTTANREQDRIELRVDGPTLKEVAKDEWKVSFEVNILITVLTDNDAFKKYRIGGLLASYFVPICGKKLGNGLADDQSVFATFLLRPEQREALVISNFGSVDTKLKVTQSAIEGHYIATLTP